MQKDFADTQVAPRIEKKEHLAGHAFAFHFTNLFYPLYFMFQILIFILRRWKSLFALHFTCLARDMSSALVLEL